MKPQFEYRQDIRVNNRGDLNPQKNGPAKAAPVFSNHYSTSRLLLPGSRKHAFLNQISTWILCCIQTEFDIDKGRL